MEAFAARYGGRYDTWDFGLQSRSLPELHMRSLLSQISDPS
jgi:hypothetical protein